MKTLPDTQYPAPYPWPTAATRVKAKNTGVVAAIVIRGSLEVGCGPQSGRVHRRLRRRDHLGYALDQGHHEAVTLVLSQPLLGLSLQDARDEAEPGQ